jgi:hypothetical protein
MREHAERIGGNPLLRARPRVMANWAGILEHAHDPADFRFLTSAQLRVGTGYGHAHNDTLDLQLVAHGVRMLNDIGWRGSYSSPAPTFSQLHNTVEVDETNWHGHAWIDAFSPAAGVSYMHATATPPALHPSITGRDRGVALIDVDPGQAGTVPPSPLPYTHQTRFDPAAVTPRTYLFDVQRVAGGRIHTWCFHGTYSDAFDVNMKNRTAGLMEPESVYLRRFLVGDDLKYVGDAPETVVATWRLRRGSDVIEAATRDGKPVSLPQHGGEQVMLGGTFDPAAPRKFTRVHLVDHAATRLLVAHIQPNAPTVTQTWPFLFAQKRSEQPGDAVFASIIEPYAGEPFIREVRKLAVTGGRAGSARAVAVQVTLLDGRQDLCFSDLPQAENGGGPDAAKPAAARTGSQPRRFAGAATDGRFAFVRTDDRGLALAKLVGGTVLSMPTGSLRVDRPERGGAVTRVDYPTRRVWVSGDWSGARCEGEVVEFGNDLHRTSFTVIDARAEGREVVFTLDKPLDLSYAHIVAVNEADRTVEVNVMPVALSHKGMDAGLSCTADGGTRAWKCAVHGDRTYRIDAPITAAEFPVGGVLRVWELGVGDRARMVSHATLRRGVGGGTYAVKSNTQATFSPK